MRVEVRVALKSRTAVRRALVTGAPQIMNVTAAQPGAAVAGWSAAVTRDPPVMIGFRTRTRRGGGRA
jgi:hypothetical protein